jgi:hypothetical protein
MGAVIVVDFTLKRNVATEFSADVYTNDMRCECFDVIAGCHKLAFEAIIVSAAFRHQQSGVRAIAIYANSKNLRIVNQLALLISHIQEPDHSPALNQ